MCRYCGDEMESYPSEIKRNKNTFCSQDHYHKWISENKIRSGQNSIFWKNAKVEVVCKQCGTITLRYKSQIKWRGSSFCSRACRALWHSLNKSGNNSWKWVNKIKCKCLICGKEFERQPNTIKKGYGKYCSHKCKGIAKKGINNPNWNNGSSFLPYCPLWNNPFRDNVREFYRNICVECGRTKEENKENMIVHHVTYNKGALCKEGEEVKDRLFVTLCRSCHGKTIPLPRRDYYKEKYTKLIKENYNGHCYALPEKVS